MGKLTSDIAFLNRNTKRRIGVNKKQEIKPKRKKRKKDLEKLHQNAVQASKNSLTRVYRNGAKGKEIRKGNLPASKFHKAKLQGEVAKLLDQDTSKKPTNVFESSSEILRIDLKNNEKKTIEEDSVSSEGYTQCPPMVSKKQSTTSRKYPWSAMFRYEEFCAIICSENFDDPSTILSQLPDPLQKVKESLKRVHMNAMRQHFLRPDMNINDYIIDLRNQSSSKTMVDETDSSIHVSNIPVESRLSDHTSNTSLTADIVEESHPETSQRTTSEVENKSHSSNFEFSISNEKARTMNKINIDTTKNFHLPRELFDQPCSTTTTLTNDDSIIENNDGRYVKRDIDNVRCNARFKKHDKLIFKNCAKYIEDVEAEKALSHMKMGKRFTFISDSSKRKAPCDLAHTQKYIKDLIKDYESRRTIKDTTDISDTDSCTKLRERVTAWKTTKSLKHVPAILRKSACDATSLNDLTFILDQKRNGTNFIGTSIKHPEFNLKMYPSRSTNDTILDAQRVKSNKRPEKQHRTTKEKPSTSTHRTVNLHLPIETNAGNKNNKLNMKKEPNRYTQYRPQKSVTFSKGILLNADTLTMESHYDQNHDTIKPVNVDKSTTTMHPINFQILDGNQHLLLNPERIHRSDIARTQPIQYTDCECSKNPRDDIESIPVYLKIIKQPMKARAEENMIHQSLINRPVTTFATCGQTLPNQSTVQQPVVPVTSQNLQFMLRESDPRLYAFSDLQNLQLLTLNDSQNMYVSALNSSHEQKQANECAMRHNVNQPTKYLAFEKDFSTQRIPIYYHNNNEKTTTQEYLPCKVVTALQKQNNDKVCIHEPSSRVILVQGSNLHNEDRQFIDPNCKHLI